MSLLKQAAGVENRSWATDIASGFPGDVTGTTGWQQGMVWAGPGPSPLIMSGDRAMRLSAVFGCLRILSETIATMKLKAETEFLDGIPKPSKLPQYLRFQPPQGSRINYLSQVLLSLLTAGNAYVLTVRNQLGDVVDLVVLNPNSVTVSRVNGVVTYRCQNITLDPNYDVMHILGMCMPGDIVGLSPIGYARETIGLGLAAQDFGRGFFENGAMPSAVIEIPGIADDPLNVKARRVAETWKETHGGASNAAKVGVLTGGAKLNAFSIHPDDAQFLETRQFQVSDIARFYGVFPHLLNDASQSTSWGSGLAELNLAFGQYGLQPWVERIDEAHCRLETTCGRPSSMIHLDMDGKLRADRKERYEAYVSGVEARFLTINEVRAEEGLPPVDWGDEPFIPERITVQDAEVADPNLLPAPPDGRIVPQPAPPTAPPGGAP